VLETSPLPCSQCCRPSTHNLDGKRSTQLVECLPSWTAWVSNHSSKYFGQLAVDVMWHVTNDQAKNLSTIWLGGKNEVEIQPKLQGPGICMRSSVISSSRHSIQSMTFRVIQCKISVWSTRKSGLVPSLQTSGILLRSQEHRPTEHWSSRFTAMASFTLRACFVIVVFHTVPAPSCFLSINILSILWAEIDPTRLNKSSISAGSIVALGEHAIPLALLWPQPADLC
jgi:hypothetical protein